MLFPPGIYLYTGSAMNGLRGRLARHVGKRKKLRWHVDYLLECPDARVKQILALPSAGRQECRWNRRLASLPGAVVALKGFGASDCIAGCGAHLLFFPRTIGPERISSQMARLTEALAPARANAGALPPRGV